MGKRITLTPVTRIEGHAKVLVDVDDAGQVEHGHLQVLEIRGFEKFLENMELFKMPQFTARICGVCPAAHHLVSVQAIENGLQMTIPVNARRLRELLYVGHILHSHALSTFLLLGPDLILGVDSPAAERNVFGILKADPEAAKKALRLRTIGQLTVEAVGGRGVHPVTAVPGGIAYRPADDRMARIAAWGEEALGLLDDLAGIVKARLETLAEIREATTLPFISMAVSQQGKADFLTGEVRVLDTDGTPILSFAPEKYADHLVEGVMPGSYMKNVRVRGREDRVQVVGPLARLHANDRLGTPKADAMLQEYRRETGGKMAVTDFIRARMIEMTHCAERMAAIPGEMDAGPVKADEPPYREGRYVGLIEAPRGVLIHDYTADDKGRITSANLIVATQNNYDAIDASVTATARAFYGKKADDHFMNGLEFVVRCFDPCLACATHALGRMPMEVIVRRGAEIVRRFERR